MSYFDIMFVYWVYAPLHMSYIDLLDRFGVIQGVCFIILYMIVYVGRGP